jgi:hypothetical protein
MYWAPTNRDPLDRAPIYWVPINCVPINCVPIDAEPMVDPQIVGSLRIRAGSEVGLLDAGRRRAGKWSRFGFRHASPIGRRASAGGAPGAVQERHVPSFIADPAGLCLQNVSI